MKSEKPQLKLLSFGDNFQARLSLIAGLHNNSAQEHQTHAIDLTAYQNKTLRTEPTWSFEHQSEEKIYHHTFPIKDKELPRDLVSGSISGPEYDGAIWVTEGLQASAEQASVLKILRCCGATLLIFIETPDEQDEALDLIESDLRERCESAGFPGNEVKILRGDSTKESAAQALYKACDEVFFPKPIKPNTFMMPIEDVFDIKHKGLVVTGRVERGIVKVGQELELLGIRPARRVTAVAIESFRKGISAAEVGLNIGMMLRGVQRIELERGQVLAQPGTVQVSDLFEAEAYFYPPEYGPKYPPMLGQPFDIILSRCKSRATLTIGGLLSDTVTSVTIRTLQPIAIEHLTIFAIIAESRSAGAGFVTKIFDSARFL